MLKQFYPDSCADSTWQIDFRALYQEGCRGILFDIDNTLVPHGAPADKRVKKLFLELAEIGITPCLISNNKLMRVKSFADSLGVLFIENAHKPSAKNYRRAMELIHTNTENTVFIGDQLFTDIYGARRAGIKTILVKPIHPSEEIQIVLKRFLEKIVLHFYWKEKSREKQRKTKGNGA